MEDGSLVASLSVELMIMSKSLKNEPLLGSLWRVEEVEESEEKDEVEERQRSLYR